ncbi:glutathione S-transferase family protein [Cupriavidus basilensis]|uniref:glutathione S-transferase family protein n=1 Tax=Cupriavidus basilensis TaxID=68895 RepID=UPI0039F6F4FB
MRIIDTQRSGNCWKVRLLASFLGINLRRTTLSIDRGDLKSATFVADAPMKKVPVLELDDGSMLSESGAILFYLAHGTRWWPQELNEQAQTLAWMHFEQEQHMRPLAQLRLHLALKKDLTLFDAQVRNWLQESNDALAILEARLTTGRQWVSTNTAPSISDVALYPYTRMSPMGGVALNDYPLVQAWMARIESLPGYEPLFPGQPDLNFSTLETSS